jgi:hypothetical protein
VRVEELDLALAGADDLRGHAAATAATWPAVSAAKAAAIATVTTAEAVATAEPITAAETISAAEARIVTSERIEALFPETVPLVAPPAATFVVTHELNVPSSPSPISTPTLRRDAQGNGAGNPARSDDLITQKAAGRERN